MEKGNDMMYQSHYSSMNSKAGSVMSPKTPKNESPTKGEGSLKDKIEYMQEELRIVTDDVNYSKKDLHILRGQKEHLENVLSMKAIDVRKSLANEIVKVDNSLNRSMKAQIAENELLLNQIKELQSEKDMLFNTLNVLLKKIDVLESKV